MKTFRRLTSIILFGTMTPPTLLSHGLFLTAHLIFTGILGVIFAYLIQSITAKNYYFKGWLYSVAVWLMSYAVSRLLPPFQVIINSPITTLINLINATLFGLILAWALKWLDNKEKLCRDVLHPLKLGGLRRMITQT